MRVLVAGAASGLARQVVELLLADGHQVAGIDRRPWPGAPPRLALHAVDLRKRAAEDVFRRFKPEVVVHMATVTSLVMAGEERTRMNLGGTRAVFEHAHAYGAKHVVFVGRHTYYGAAADLALYHREEEPPQSLGTFPELADLVAADLFAGTTLWRGPHTTSVLRLCYTLGPSRQGTLASFLRGHRAPLVLGYDPLFQFLDESDAARAIVLAVEKRPQGIFNVAGPAPLPLSTIIEGTGRTAVSVPEPLLKLLIGRFGFPSLPRGALEHLKFPVVVDASAFRKATGFEFQVDEVETLRRFRALGQ